MPTINFPTGPSTNDTYNLGTRTWRWNGEAWELQPLTGGFTGSQGYTGSAGATGAQGATGYTGSAGTADGGTSLTISNTSTDDSILATTTEDSSSAGPVLTLKRNSSSPADADYLGQLKFKGENDADQEVVYAKITAKIQDATDGTEDGLIEFANRKAGSNAITMRLKSDKLMLLNGTGLEADGDVDFTDSTSSLGLPSGTTAQAPSAASSEGHIRYDTDNNAIYFSNGSSWAKISSTPAGLSSISPTSFLEGTSETITLTGTGFLSSNLVVTFTHNSNDYTTTVTPSSGTTASATTPSGLVSAVSGGDSVSVKVTNSDGSDSGTQTLSVSSLPSGGTITTSGNYRIHTFTSSGTFTNPISNLSVEYLVIAGGGSGGAGGSSVAGGGGGAGGYRTNVSGENSGGGNSAESSMTLSATSYTVTVGAGASRPANNSDSGGSRGSNSTFNGITSTGGGGGGGNSADSGSCCLS